jgi:hypothetical protein
MNISNATSAGSQYADPYQTNDQGGLQDFESLGNALQSGDLSDAQSAFSQLEQDMPGLSQLLQSGSSSSSSSTQNSPIATALQSLQSSLQSGDLSGAQQAFANLQQNLQGTSGTHHGRGHHHHSWGGGETGQTSGAASNDPSESESGFSISITILDVQA